MRRGPRDAMLEIALREDEILEESIARGEHAEDHQGTQRELARLRHLTKENERDREKPHLQPERVLPERVNRSRSDECGQRRVDAVHREGEVEDVKRDGDQPPM